jgi:hypothetical protein
MNWGTTNSQFDGNVGIGTPPDISIKLDVNGYTRISGELVGAYNFVTRISTYIKPILNYIGNYYYWSLNYANYLGNGSTKEYAFKIYVWNVQASIELGYCYIGSSFVNVVNNTIYTSRKIDHYAYGIYSPIISAVDTNIDFMTLNDGYGMSNKKIVFENIAFSAY